jgi:hypothetical protein
MDTSLMISAGYEDVPVRAGRKVFPEVDGNVVRIIKQEKPILALPGEPNNRIICGVAYPPVQSNILQISFDRLSCASINEKDLRETGCVGCLARTHHVWIRIKYIPLRQSLNLTFLNKLERNLRFSSPTDPIQDKSALLC